MSQMNPQYQEKIVIAARVGRPSGRTKSSPNR